MTFNLVSKSTITKTGWLYYWINGKDCYYCGLDRAILLRQVSWINESANWHLTLPTYTCLTKTLCLLTYLLFRGFASSSNSATDPSEEQRLLRLSTDTLLPLPALPALMSWGTGSLERERPLSIRDGEASMSLRIFLWLLETKTDLKYVCEGRKRLQLTSLTEIRLLFFYPSDSQKKIILQTDGLKWIMQGTKRGNGSHLSK